jgi:hypothetical protein
MKEMNRDGEWVEPERQRPKRSDDPPERSMAELYAIARYQRTLIYCILFLLLDYGIAMAMPEEVRLFLLLPHLAVGVIAAIYVFRLSLEIYSTGTGIALAIGTMIPCIGLLVLVVINSKATGTLNVYGVRVGFLGVGGTEMARLKRWTERDRDRS